MCRSQSEEALPWRLDLWPALGPHVSGDGHPQGQLLLQKSLCKRPCPHTGTHLLKETVTALPPRRALHLPSLRHGTVLTLDKCDQGASFGNWLEDDMEDLERVRGQTEVQETNIFKNSPRRFSTQSARARPLSFPKEIKGTLREESL